jgi:hypothetical protein
MELRLETAMASGSAAATARAQERLMATSSPVPLAAETMTEPVLVPSQAMKVRHHILLVKQDQKLLFLM